MVIHDIEFPIYRLPYGITNIERRASGIVELEHSGKYTVLDNTSLSADTIGKRRLALKTINTEYRKDTGKDKYILTRLKNPIFSYSELLKQAKTRNVYFVDNLGYIFNYIKKNKCTLKYIPIEYVKVTGNFPYKYSIKVEGIYSEFKLAYIDTDSIPKYAGVLYTKVGPIIYDLSTVKEKDSWRKV